MVAANGHLELADPDYRTRSQRLAAVAARLAQLGEIELRGELYPVTQDHDQPALLQLDRGAVPFFGVRPFGVHLCAFVRQPRGLAVWIAVRARDRTFPGQWDNTVAGGQPLGLSLRDNLVKECAEEASMPATLATQAVLVSKLTYVREDPTGLKPDTLFCFDLEVPPDFEPRPHDGEVERFLLLPIRDAAEAVRNSAICKPNCALVWIDFFLRHGTLDDELTSSERQVLTAGLRRQLIH